MKQKKNLSLLQEGETGRVKALTNEESMKRRLQELGIIEGTKIKCMQISPFGDPMAFLVRGTLIALRKDDSKNIIIC